MIFDGVKGFNLLNNNVNAVSLARTHRRMQTSSFEIRVQYGPPACGRRSILDPNFSGFRSAFADASSPDSRHCPSTLFLRNTVLANTLFLRNMVLANTLF